MLGLILSYNCEYFVIKILNIYEQIASKIALEEKREASGLTCPDASLSSSNA
jgi:hypothetical protein